MRAPAGSAGSVSDSSQARPRRLPSEYDRAPAVDDHAVVQMQRDGSGQDQPLHVAPDALELLGALAVVDADHILVDDWSVVELLGHVVGRGPDQLNSPLMRAAVGICTGER